MWDTIRGAQEVPSLFSVREELSTRAPGSSGRTKGVGHYGKWLAHVKGLLRRVPS